MERFWSKVLKIDGECWEWQASLRGDPKKKMYGAFKLNGKMMIASRVSYMLHYGDIPTGFLVCHSCDNSKCVNPDHLFLGTYKDNYEDAVKKARINPQRAKGKIRSGHPSQRTWNEGCRCRECVDLSNSRKKRWRERTGRN